MTFLPPNQQRRSTEGITRLLFLATLCRKKQPNRNYITGISSTRWDNKQTVWCRSDRLSSREIANQHRRSQESAVRAVWDSSPAPNELSHRALSVSWHHKTHPLQLQLTTTTKLTTINITTTASGLVFVQLTWFSFFLELIHTKPENPNADLRNLFTLFI